MNTRNSLTFLTTILFILCICFLPLYSPAFGQEKAANAPTAQAASEKQSPKTAAQAEIPVLKRFSNGFETVISLSPLLGLLGTVVGLITSLSSLRLGDIESSQAA